MGKVIEIDDYISNKELTFKRLKYLFYTKVKDNIAKYDTALAKQTERLIKKAKTTEEIMDILFWVVGVLRSMYGVTEDIKL